MKQLLTTLRITVNVTYLLLSSKRALCTFLDFREINHFYFKKIAMTKLLEWISVLSALFAVWYSLIAGYVKHPLIEKHMNLILLSPVLFVMSFGAYAVVVVLYRVFTFNNCEEAAKELQAEIAEAKKDLLDKGLKL